MKFKLNKFINLISIFYVLLYCFDAPIQYILYKIGFNNIILYLKAMIPLLLIIFGFSKSFKLDTINKRITKIILLIILSLIIAIINNLPFIQIAYGLKTIFPFIAFYYYEKYLNVGSKHFKKIFRILSPIIILGIVLDKYISFPWEGISYQVGDVSYQISRQWETFGVARLSGFERASYDSATIICLLLVINYIYNIIFNKKNTWIDNILCIGCAYGIYLTTFKTAYLFLFIMMIYYILVRFHKLLIKQDKIVAEFIIKIFTIGIFLYGLIPPLLMKIGMTIKNVDENSVIYSFLFKSYTIRMNTTWRDAIDLLDLSKFNGLFGRGIGGIGTAQQYSEQSLYNAGDNIFIYLFVTLGILIIPLIFGLIKTIIITKFNSNSEYIMFYLLLIVFCFGATINVIDSPILMSMLGLLLSYYVNMQNASIKITCAGYDYKKIRATV